MSFNLSSYFLSDLPFFEHQEKIYSFLDVWTLSQRTQIPNLSKGEFVGLICVKDPKTLYFLFKLMSIGAIPVLLSPKATSFEILNFKKRLCFDKTLNPLEIIFNSAEHQEIDLSINDTALICFTSGSTGVPKATPLTYNNIFSSAQGSNEFYSIDATDRYLHTLPLNHVGGLMIVFRSLLAKCLCVFPDKNIPYSAYRPSILSLVPTQLLRLIEESFLKSCKVILVGGDKFPMDKIHHIKNLPVSLTYGMTETCAQIAASLPFETKMKVLPFRKVKISQDGLIWVGGDTCFKGYLNEQTIKDNDGFFQTSDCGALEESYLEVFHRNDDIFIRGGENISCREIETAALKIDSIERAKVIPFKDFELGEIPILFYQTKGNFSDQVLKEKLLPFLSPYKIPHRFIKIEQENDFKWQRAHLLSYLENSP